jgi:hypothetical protein
MQTKLDTLSQLQTTRTAQQAVSFELFDQCPGWDLAPDWVLGMVDKYGCQNILEIGSGPNPTLSPDVVSDRKLRYVVNDVDPHELSQADIAYDRWVGDISNGAPPHMRSRFDLVFSRMVNEHVVDGRRYHGNIRELLVPGGISAHCFSTLYCLPFLTNRLLPEFISDFMLPLFDPRDRLKHGKFRAYYSWGRGPSRRMISNFESLGFDVLKYVGYFGHGYYWRWPALHRLELQKARALVAKPIPALCSFAMLIARRESEPPSVHAPSSRL